MKKITLLITALLVFSISHAQDVTTEEIQMVQELFGSEKKAIIEENVDLTGVNADSFWKLYTEYENNDRKLVRLNLNYCKSIR